MLGVAIGFTVMIMLVGIGLMQLFDIYPTSYTVLRFASISYLLYLSWKIASAKTDLEQSGNTIGKPFTFFQAALFQWVNPKAWTMALTAISAYTPPNHPVYSVLIVALVFGAVNLPSVSVWVVAGTRLRNFLKNPLKLRVFNISAAFLLIGSLYPVLFPAS